MTDIEFVCNTRNSELDIIDEDNYSFCQDLGSNEDGNYRFALQKLKIEFSDYVT